MKRKQPSFRQLAAIARELYGRPEYAGWKLRIVERCLALQLEPPDNQTLTKVMDAVEVVLALETRRAQSFEPLPAIRQEKYVPNRWDQIHPKILNHFKQAGNSLRPPVDNSPSESPTETSSTVQVQDEAAALETFWVQFRAKEIDLPHLLAEFQRVVVERPADWSQSDVRLASIDVNSRLRATQCQVCFNGDRRRIWHHIIAVKNGGSASPRNRIALCAQCHKQLHPHLRRWPGEDGGWIDVADFVSAVTDPIYRPPAQKERRQKYDDDPRRGDK
jgi:hypothetical protein